MRDALINGVPGADPDETLNYFLGFEELVTSISVPATKSSAAIVAAIIRMARGLDMNVVAEGVETEEQKEFLRQEGCDAIQGFLFSRPLPASDLTELLRGHRSPSAVRGER